MISYEDVVAAIDWLSAAFGFRESGERFTDGEGRVTHAELSFDGADVMLGWPGSDYRSPKQHAQECEQAARWLATPWVVDGVHVEVDDLDAHYERARAEGATILREPEDLPFGRLYSAADLEGHRWMFMQPA
jgi:PhnB protein